jgi:hypothetical protein
MYKLKLLILLLLAVPLHAADVYKSVDRDGNTVFSDVPSENAEKIEVRDLPTIPALEQQPARSLKAEPVERYTTLMITSPKNDETYFRSEGDLVVSLQIQPRLANGDTVVLYLNSNEFLSGKSSSYSIPELDRGTYQLRVAIKDPSGKIIKSSETVAFHLRQASALNRPPAPKSGN